MRICSRESSRGSSSAAHNDACHGYQGVVYAPAPYGTFLGRVVVKNPDSDLEQVHAIQDQITLTSVPRKDPDPDYRIPKLTISMLNSSLSTDDPYTRIMQLNARFTPFNPPRNISDKPRVDTMMRRAGIHDGHYTPTVNKVSDVTHVMQADMEAAENKPGKNINLKNGWTVQNPSTQGDYGTDYQIRSYMADKGYLGLVAGEVVYPTYARNVTLGPRQAYTITFSSKPPLADDGFWSLTAYDQEQFLIPNRLGRYALGDRSNLKYADGSSVYGEDSTKEDGAFQILVQPADMQPPRRWMNK